MVYKESHDRCLLDVHRVTLRLPEDSCSGLSPVARTWPSTCLLPQGPAWSMSDPSWAMRHTGISDGCFEVRKLCQLPSSSNKLPFGIVLPGGLHQIGLSPKAFDTQLWPELWSLSAVCGNLRLLNVGLIGLGLGVRNHDCPPLEGLQALIREAPAIQTLSLSTSFDPSEEDAGDEDLFRFSQIFPPVTSWQQPNLTHLNLQRARHIVPRSCRSALHKPSRTKKSATGMCPAIGWPMGRFRRGTSSPA